MKTIYIHPIQENIHLEIAERKGIGHPDTICDAIAEEVSIALCKHYLDHFGRILHHNVDKVLLVGGEAAPRFGGGEVVKPIELYIAGRATHEFQGKKIPVDELTQDAARNWIRRNIRFLDPEKHIVVIPKIRKGSEALVNLFSRDTHTPLANDTSFAVGYYPFSPLEKQILETSSQFNTFPFMGEDTKIMAVQKEETTHLTIAAAMIGQFVASPADYISKINTIKTTLQKPHLHIDVNTADDYKNNSFYLTVTGTSAESGDDGQVGRGNRYSGLITPYRPMTLEAYAGKNPISHVGKLYTVFAFDLAKAICTQKLAEEARIFIVSQIGRPITEPQLLEIQLKNPTAPPSTIEQLVQANLSQLPQLWSKIISSNYIS